MEPPTPSHPSSPRHPSPSLVPSVSTVSLSYLFPLVPKSPLFTIVSDSPFDFPLGRVPLAPIAAPAGSRRANKRKRDEQDSPAPREEKAEEREPNPRRLFVPDSEDEDEDKENWIEDGVRWVRSIEVARR